MRSVAKMKYLSTENSYTTKELPLYDVKFGVPCAISPRSITGPITCYKKMYSKHDERFFPTQFYICFLKMKIGLWIFHARKC